MKHPIWIRAYSFLASILKLPRAGELLWVISYRFVLLL